MPPARREWLEAPGPRHAPVGDRVELDPASPVWAAVSVVGHRRRNEDWVGGLQLTGPSGWLAVVCDGIGGGPGGDEASQLAGTTWLRVAADQLGGGTEPEMALAAGFDAAMHRIIQLCEQLRAEAGTTLTGAWWEEEQGRVHIVHVGDTRAYLGDPLGEVTPLTEDHSLAAEIERSGLISPDTAEQIPGRNVLMRALGPEPVDADHSLHLLPPDARLVLCSDGVWGLLEAVDGMFVPAGAPDMAALALVELALLAGSNDNCTALVLDPGRR